MSILTQEQFPIHAVAARTIHRAQGLSMDTLAFEPTGIRTHGLIYTALSRIRDPANLYILNKLQSKQIKVDTNVLAEVKRLQTSAKWTPLQKQIFRLSS